MGIYDEKENAVYVGVLMGRPSQQFIVGGLFMHHLSQRLPSIHVFTGYIQSICTPGYHRRNGPKEIFWSLLVPSKTARLSRLPIVVFVYDMLILGPGNNVESIGRLHSLPHEDTLSTFAGF